MNDGSSAASRYALTRGVHGKPSSARSEVKPSYGSLDRSSWETTIQSGCRSAVSLSATVSTPTVHATWATRDVPFVGGLSPSGESHRRRTAGSSSGSGAMLRAIQLEMMFGGFRRGRPPRGESRRAIHSRENPQFADLTMTWGWRGGSVDERVRASTATTWSRTAAGDLESPRPSLRADGDRLHGHPPAKARSQTIEYQDDPSPTSSAGDPPTLVR